MLKLLIKIKSKTYITSSYLWIVFSLILCTFCESHIILYLNFISNSLSFNYLKISLFFSLSHMQIINKLYEISNS